MPIRFSTYVKAANSFVAMNSSETESNAVGLLNGREVRLSGGDPGVRLDVMGARADFVESLVAEFGEGMRAEAERMLGSGLEAKPLTSRIILKLDEIGRAQARLPMSARLSDIVRNAARRDASSLTREQFQRLKGLYGNRLGTTEIFDEAEIIRVQAESYYARLGACTAEEIARAMADDSPLDETNPQSVHNHAVREIVETAIKLQFDLSDRFRALYRRSGGLFTELYPAICRCENRGSEIISITTRLAAQAHLNKSAPGELPADDPHLRKTLSELFPELVVQMHGTDAALDSLESRLLPLANRFDALKSAGKNVGWQDIVAIRSELKSARDALLLAAEKGIPYPDSDAVFRPDPGLLKELSRLIDGISSDVSAFIADYQREQRLSQVNESFPDVSKSRLFSSLGAAVLGRLVGEETVASIRDVMQELHEILVMVVVNRASVSMQTANNSLTNAIAACNKLKEKMRELTELLKEILKELEGGKGGGKKAEPVNPIIRQIVESLREDERRELKEEIEEAAEANVLGSMLILDEEQILGFVRRLESEDFGRRSLD